MISLLSTTHSAIFFTALVLLASTAMFASPASVQADQKLADYQRVIVADDALPVTKMAAEELAHYVGKLTKRDIPVVPATQENASADGLSFFVGDKAAQLALGKSPAPWKMEEWMLKTVDKGLVLAGHDEAGRANSVSVAGGSTLAVYSLLDDHLGIRWFWPGETGEYVPDTAPATLPDFDKRQQPRFIIRNYIMGYTSYHNDAYRGDAANWARRTRQGWVPAATFGHSWFYAFNLRKKGDENPYLQEHPEWFALVNGQRRPPQMCTTHPQVIDRMVEYVLADTKRNITTISPSDGAGFCQCTEETKSDYHKKHNIPSCTSLDVPGLIAYDGKTPQLSDRIFTYANEIARRVREKDPNKGVGMFAYTFYNKPPVNIDKLEPNLYLSFVFQAQSHVDPIMYEEWHKSIAGWKAKGAKMVVREGWGNHYLLDLPFIYPREIHRSLKDAADEGFIAAYGEGSKSFATQAPNTWAVVRSMWNPDSNYDALMDDYYTKAYGPAADAMRKYFGVWDTALHENWEKRRFITPSRGVGYVNLVNSWHTTLPQSTVKEAEQALKAAEKIVGSNNQYAARVSLHRIGQDYSALMLELLDCYRQLAELGMDMEFFSIAVEKPEYNLEKRNRILKRAYELGEKREDMMLAYRDLPAMDEGLYAITNDKQIRQWHSNVKRLLEIDKPTRITKASLAEMNAMSEASKAATTKAPATEPAAKPAVKMNTAPQQSTAAVTIDAVTPTWALSRKPSAQHDTPSVLAIGLGYGRNEVAGIKREVFDERYIHARVSEEWVSPEQWKDYRLVIVANIAEPLKDAKAQAAMLDYLEQGGRLMLLGTAMRSFENADANVYAALGGSGYSFVRSQDADKPPTINEHHPDLQQSQDVKPDALAKAFTGGYAMRTVSPDAAVLVANNGRPMAVISAHGQGRTIFIGRELFRVRIEEKRNEQDQGGDALRDWYKHLVTQIAPTK